MHTMRIRNHSYMQELSPVCIKIQNVSLELQTSKRRPAKKLQIEFLPNINSEEVIKSPKNEPLTIQRINYPGPRQKSERLPNIRPAKITDGFKTSFANTSNLTEKIKKVEISKQLPLSVTSSPKLPYHNRSKSITKVSYKDAVRFSDWAQFSKPELDHMWRTLLNLTNGIKVLEQKAQFKYFVGKGNNSELIKRLLGNRSWWIATDNQSEANFIWTQWKDKSICEALPEGHKLTHEIDLNTKPTISYQVPVRIKEIYRQVDLTDLGLYRIKNSHSYTAIKCVESNPLMNKLYNKIEFNQLLANKKGLYKSLKFYYEALGQKVFSYHPLTYHIKNCTGTEYEKFLESFQMFDKRKAKKKCKNLWIIKPGENSNRGRGIRVCKNLSEIKEVIRDHGDGNKTSIVQKYMEKPFLLHGRKFDIRCYALLTTVNGIIQGYFYNDGYIRTSCAEFTLKDTENNYIHLTNDAIQKHSEDYGKFEDNNKMSYKEFQRYLDQHHTDKKYNFFNNTLVQIKNIVKDTIQAVFLKIDCKKRVNCMEILGYDFMLDHKLKPWIIEVNTNPCLELSSSYLSYLIPAMVENSFRIALDCNFPPNFGHRSQFDPLPENRYELIFHELVDGVKLKEVLKGWNDSEVSDVGDES